MRTKYFLPVFIFCFLLACKESEPLPPTLVFDDQEWMSKNLDVDHFANGDLIPEVSTKEAWEQASATGQPAWCYYENDPSNGKKYGKLYNWYAINDPRGLAPKGWHVPNDSEFTVLIQLMGGDDEAGKRMRKTIYFSPDKIKMMGFCAVAGGYRDASGTFIGLGYYRNWWTSTANDLQHAWIRSLGPAQNKAFRNTVPVGTGLAVRCIRNK